MKLGKQIGAGALLKVLDPSLMADEYGLKTEQIMQIVDAQAGPVPA